MVLTRSPAHCTRLRIPAALTRRPSDLPTDGYRNHVDNGDHLLRVAAKGDRVSRRWLVTFTEMIGASIVLRAVVGRTLMPSSVKMRAVRPHWVH